MKLCNLPASLALISCAAAIPSAALAQGAPEEIVVSGSYGRAPDSVKSLSQAVSYADLDLSTKGGRDEMRHRVDLTARFLCDKMGESGTSDGLTPSCRQGATRDAMERLGTIEQSAAPRGTTWVRPKAWASPYPADWTTRYP